jgi:hypothetical protein
MAKHRVHFYVLRQKHRVHCEINPYPHDAFQTYGRNNVQHKPHALASMRFSLTQVVGGSRLAAVLPRWQHRSLPLSSELQACLEETASRKREGRV